MLPEMGFRHEAPCGGGGLLEGAAALRAFFMASSGFPSLCACCKARQVLSLLVLKASSSYDEFLGVVLGTVLE